MANTQRHNQFLVERVQTGVRMEKRLLKVLKAFAEFHDLTLGDLLEGIVLHAFDGKTPFSENSRRQIKELKKFYGLDLDSRASHRLREGNSGRQADASRPIPAGHGGSNPGESRPGEKRHIRKAHSKPAEIKTMKGDNAK
ncbi:MAG: hypothetical protein WB630_12625 [Candidatus Acidiferrales bacterium]